MNILTIEKDGIFEEAINKSKFIAYSFALKNFEQIEQNLNMLQKKYSDATHICYAYKFLGSEKAVDNGEPQGTAGKPILECIKKQNYSNVLVVVVRYFGGIKLGAGGLTRAYGNSAQKVLAQSGQKQMFECKKIFFKLPISENKKVSFLSNIQDIFDLKTTYDQNINISFFAKKEQFEDVLKQIENIFSHKLEFEISEQTFLI